LRASLPAGRRGSRAADTEIEPSKSTERDENESEALT
jgi:hypothetical protein